MAAIRVFAFGLEPADCDRFARLAQQAHGGAELAAIAEPRLLAAQALAEPEALLLLRLTGADRSAIALLQRLRRGGVHNPALLQIVGPRLPSELPFAELGAVDVLAADAGDPFELQRALVHLRRLRELENRLQALESSLRESEELRQRGEHRVSELSRRLAAVEIDEELSGVRSEQAMRRSISDSLAMAQRYKVAVSCLRLAIDGFAELRERYGPGFADFVRVRTAHLIKRTVRGSDVVAREGGEDFLLLCPFTAQPEALAVAVRLTHAASAEPIEQGQRSVRATLSIGVASFAAAATEGSDLVERASAALVRARARGPEQIEVA